MNNAKPTWVKALSISRTAAMLAKRNVHYLALILPLFCTCVSIRETRSVVDKELIGKTLGWNRIVFIEINETQFHYAITHRRNSIMENPRIPANEKETLVSKLSEYSYVKGQYFDFIIQHEFAALWNKGATRLSFVDAKGKNLISAIEDITVQVLWASGSGGGKFYETIWFIKTVKPIIKSNFNDDEVPLKFTALFMQNQVKEYTIF